MSGDQPFLSQLYYDTRRMYNEARNPHHLDTHLRVAELILYGFEIMLRGNADPSSLSAFRAKLEKAEQFMDPASAEAQVLRLVRQSPQITPLMLQHLDTLARRRLEQIRSEAVLPIVVLPAEEPRQEEAKPPEQPPAKKPRKAPAKRTSRKKKAAQVQPEPLQATVVMPTEVVAAKVLSSADAKEKLPQQQQQHAEEFEGIHLKYSPAVFFDPVARGWKWSALVDTNTNAQYDVAGNIHATEEQAVASLTEFEQLLASASASQLLEDRALMGWNAQNSRRACELQRVTVPNEAGEPEDVLTEIQGTEKLRIHGPAGTVDTYILAFTGFGPNRFEASETGHTLYSRLLDTANGDDVEDLLVQLEQEAQSLGRQWQQDLVRKLSPQEQQQLGEYVVHLIACDEASGQLPIVGLFYVAMRVTDASLTDPQIDALEASVFDKI